MTAEYKVDGTVAVIVLNNPPVNGLGLSTRTALVNSMQHALSDDKIKAIIITGAGKSFSGGADINEFNSPILLAEPNLHTIIDIVENSAKPVIAAIHSICMGGGLELSLGCNYRVATRGAQIALPEVKLGIVPGAGGTQRLPRLLGLEMALNMIVSGATAMSEELAHTALFNEMIDGDLMQGALTFAHKVAHVRPLPRVRDINIDYPGYEAFLQFFRHAVKTMAGPFPAPLQCLEAVAAAVTKNFDDGIQFERSLFVELLSSTESRALRHAFFGERAGGRLLDIPKNTPIRQIQTAAIIGAGHMGSGIAMIFSNAGIPVLLLDAKQEILDKSLAAILKSYKNNLNKGIITQEQFERRISLIRGTLSYDDITKADIVIETVFEDINIKKTVFIKLDKVMKQGAILASNTSTLNLNTIAGFTERPHDVIGTHFYSPASVTRLLEIVRGAKTGRDVLSTTLHLAKKFKKIAVVSGVCDGFIGNRMIEQYNRQAVFLLEEGCLPEQIDKAIEKFGFAMGPFRMGDLIGNDIGWYARKRRYVEKPEITYSKIDDLLCELGRYGQKTGAGWYDYDIENLYSFPSQIVNEMIVAHSASLGIKRRKINDQEIIERLIFALVNEAAYILEEGIATRASDIDMVYLTCYGFPLFRGGPLFYADTVGLINVVRAMKKYAKGHYGEIWAPAPLLEKLAAQKKTFTQQ